ncbi:hypothetical protein [Paenibacillus sp. HW567]|uniref:hypothetical protein n=1 Tax=Paenibacillus sp. HW567 TaxID=1034769 RepID=UPI0003AA491D|nr:hypothetical protein [Paenibacillus sp. HW567]
MYSDKETAAGTVKISAKQIAAILGKDVDIILDDGYGRIAIQSVTLPVEQPTDYVPIKLNLTESGQLWAQYQYNGEDIISSDYVRVAVMPNTLSVKTGGAITAEYTIGSRHTRFPQTLKNGTTLNAYLSKIKVGTKPGKYYIKATVTVNNPNHPDRASVGVSSSCLQQ